MISRATSTEHPNPPSIASFWDSSEIRAVTVTFHVLLLSFSCFLFFSLCYPLPLTFLPCLLHAHFSLSPMSLRRTWTILGWYESRSAYTVLVSVYHYHVPIFTGVPFLTWAGSHEANTWPVTQNLCLMWSTLNHNIHTFLNPISYM